MIEDAIKERIEQLVQQSCQLSVGNDGSAIDESHRHQCSAWLASAQNAVRLVCESPTAAYRIKVDRIADADHAWIIHCAVGEMAALLRNLLTDAEAGLLRSVADQARAEVFDDFLDHADAYFRGGQKNEAGVIAGVVFEDTFRQICRKEEIIEKGLNLDRLIS